MSEAPIPWADERCIVCSKAKKLTLEHVIPRALGGVLTCQFLCKACNDRFGSGIDANAKIDPAIRRAGQQVRLAAPDLVARIEQGQKYVIQTLPGTVPAVMRGGEIVGRWTKLADGSLMAPEEQTISALRGMLASDGLDQREIDAALTKYEAAKIDEPVMLSDTVRVIKRSAKHEGPDFRNAEKASDLLFVKIAYEFSALLIGGAIYRDVPTFRELRRVLTEGDSGVFSVERLEAKKVAAFHGIAFEGNDPYAKFQIRFFGRQAFRVHLLGVALDLDPVAYTHDLVTNTHWHNLRDTEAA